MLPDIQGVDSAEKLGGTGFIKAATARLLILQQQNERLARKMDAAHIIDELERGLFDLDEDRIDVANILPYASMRRKYDNQAFHFRDEEK